MTQMTRSITSTFKMVLEVGEENEEEDDSMLRSGSVATICG